MRSPAGWLEEIIEARAYAATKRQYDDLKDKKAKDDFMLSSRLAHKVEQIELEIVAEDREAQADGIAAED